MRTVPKNEALSKGKFMDNPIWFYKNPGEHDFFTHAHMVLTRLSNLQIHIIDIYIQKTFKK